MRPSLADRLRSVVASRPAPAVPRVDGEQDAPLDRGPATFDAGASAVHRPVRPGGPGPGAAALLGGEWRERAEGAFILVERFYPPEARYGRSTIGTIVDRLGSGADALGVLERAWPSARGVGGSTAPALAFLDLETTGIAGGAGTQAFLVGCASIDGRGLRVQQFLLPAFEHERALLAEVSGWARTPQTLVTFNGRTFDVPLIETRYLYHRLSFPLGETPHLDMLHPARRLWRARPAIAAPPLDPFGSLRVNGERRRTVDEECCRLSVLERHLAGVHRVGDVPGFEIPSRYFRFVRDGDARPLEAVLEHNRLDLLSLALVTAHAIELIERGPSAATHVHECLGLGRVYECAGRPEDAEACFLRAAQWSAHTGLEPFARADALRRLALCRRRGGRAAEAAQVWSELADLAGCPAALRREAREALAIHFEHRIRDLSRARHLALELLAESGQGRWRTSVEHRLGRLERKQQARARGGLMMVLED